MSRKATTEFFNVVLHVIHTDSTAWPATPQRPEGGGFGHITIIVRLY